MFGFFMLFQRDMQITKLEEFFIMLEEFFSQEMNHMYFIESFHLIRIRMKLDSKVFLQGDIYERCKEFFMGHDTMEMIFFSNKYTRKIKLMHTGMNLSYRCLR